MLKIKHYATAKMLLVLVMIMIGSTKLCNGGQPEETVKKYYVADLNGSRLSAATSKTVKNLVLWQEEPGWDYAFITNNVRIVNVNKTADIEASVEVRYEIVGILRGDDLLSLQFNEVVDFYLTKDGNKDWKIKSPIIPPHISNLSAGRHAKQLISVESDKERKKKLNHLIERLREL